MLSLCNQPGSSSPGPFSCLIHRSAWRNRPKSLGRTWCVALRATENGSFRLIVTSVHCPIHSRSVTHTPFRTVSPRTRVNKGTKKVRTLEASTLSLPYSSSRSLATPLLGVSLCPSNLGTLGSARYPPCLLAG